MSPNANEMRQLSCQGLGKKRYTFDKDGDHSYLQNELEKLFPKLKAAKGKFQLQMYTRAWVEDLEGDNYVRSQWVQQATQSSGSVKML